MCITIRLTQVELSRNKLSGEKLFLEDLSVAYSVEPHNCADFFFVRCNAAKCRSSPLIIGSYNFISFDSRIKKMSIFECNLFFFAFRNYFGNMLGDIWCGVDKQDFFLATMDAIHLIAKLDLCSFHSARRVGHITSL